MEDPDTEIVVEGEERGAEFVVLLVLVEHEVFVFSVGLLHLHEVGVALLPGLQRVQRRLFLHRAD